MFEKSLVLEAGIDAKQSAVATACSVAFEMAVLATMLLVPLYFHEGIALTFKSPELPLRAPVSGYEKVVDLAAVPKPMRGDNLFHLPVAAPAAASAAHSLPGTGRLREDDTGFADPTINIVGSDPSGSPLGHVLAEPRVTPNVGLAPAQKTKVSGGVAEGMVLRRVVPQYPELARRVRVEGAVTLAALISREGRIEQLQVLSGHPLLQKAALDAVRQWLYKPYRLNGEPVEVETTITVNFRLSGGQ
jgi:protein TonB